MKYSEKGKFEKWRPKQTTVPPKWGSLVNTVTGHLWPVLLFEDVDMTWCCNRAPSRKKKTFSPRLAPFLRFPNSICFLVSLSSSKLPQVDAITSYHLPYFPWACFLQCIFQISLLDFLEAVKLMELGYSQKAGKTLSFKDRSINMFLEKKN